MLGLYYSFLVKAILTVTEPTLASLSKEIHCMFLVVNFIATQDQEVNYSQTLWASKLDSQI